MSNYDSWKTNAPDGQELVNPQCGPECDGCPDCAALPPPSDIPREPPPGTWASIARVMADGDDSGFDWDRWKDEMKDSMG